MNVLQSLKQQLNNCSEKSILKKHHKLFKTYLFF